MSKFVVLEPHCIGIEAFFFLAESFFRSRYQVNKTRIELKLTFLFLTLPQFIKLSAICGLFERHPQRLSVSNRIPTIMESFPLNARNSCLKINPRQSEIHGAKRYLLCVQQKFESNTLTAPAIQTICLFR